jgi:hypothetical protein
MRTLLPPREGVWTGGRANVEVARPARRDYGSSAVFCSGSAEVLTGVD